MKTVLKLIAPKLVGERAEAIANDLYENHTDKVYFENHFLQKLLDYKLAVLFHNDISLDELNFKLRSLIIDNHIAVDMMAAEIDENSATDEILDIVGRYFKKQGWIVCEFHKDPNVYYLSVIPISSKKELENEIQKLGLFVKFFE